jgi:hypothetical protein
MAALRGGALEGLEQGAAVRRLHARLVAVHQPPLLPLALAPATRAAAAAALLATPFIIFVFLLQQRGQHRLKPRRREPSPSR